jgi:hypothetical protein
MQRDLQANALSAGGLTRRWRRYRLLLKRAFPDAGTVGPSRGFQGVCLPAPIGVECA